ncbi:MAG TPA: sigma-70 family RNA polymerase sigma factor [Acidimicrobiales bacterium]|nr:sigma-70 family RNA polymerase sigma factor [Acidimicrobiales bacterium]
MDLPGHPNHLDRLAERARLGDQAAWEAFIVASYDAVRRMCAAMVDRQSAEDLAQETFTRSVRALARFRGECSARAWILSIAYRVCADELRYLTRRREHQDDGGRHRDREDRRVPDVAEQVAVDDLLARLEPHRRAAFVLTQILGMPYDAAAVVCQCPPGTIRSRVARARDDLVAMTSVQDVGRRA